MAPPLRTAFPTPRQAYSEACGQGRRSFDAIAGTALIFLQGMSPLSAFDAIRPFLHPFLGVVNYFAIRDATSPPTWVLILLCSFHAW